MDELLKDIDNRITHIVYRLDNLRGQFRTFKEEYQELCNTIVILEEELKNIYQFRAQLIISNTATLE